MYYTFLQWTYEEPIYRNYEKYVQHIWREFVERTPLESSEVDPDLYSVALSYMAQTIFPGPERTREEFERNAFVNSDKLYKAFLNIRQTVGDLLEWYEKNPPAVSSRLDKKELNSFNQKLLDTPLLPEGFQLSKQQQSMFEDLSARVPHVFFGDRLKVLEKMYEIHPYHPAVYRGAGKLAEYLEVLARSVVNAELLGDMDELIESKIAFADECRFTEYQPQAIMIFLELLRLDPSDSRNVCLRLIPTLLKEKHTAAAERWTSTLSEGAAKAFFETVIALRKNESPETISNKADAVHRFNPYIKDFITHRHHRHLYGDLNAGAGSSEEALFILDEMELMQLSASSMREYLTK
ncbi:hypothetical protein [Salimicrobium halophilum]|uniref:Uncharacterized protein n=1 Tax=Salimicrobium halophilum TaxID=86666 RepID=A0A1G8S8M0_9BACI|nr:hypothetical protein [Salimicrobium halophilum]SDJ25547.1 hypothetical protein SAMN04490247_1314 [Salimicrobium halophilum]